MMTYRKHLCALLALLSLQSVALGQQQPWQLVMDNDGNEARTMKAMTSDEFLAQRMGPLAGSKLDCIFYCTNATFGLATRKSAAWQMRDYSRSGHDGYDIAKLVDAGVDPLQVTVEFGKQHGIRVFNSIRMNDIHDHNFKTTYAKPMFLHNTWKQAHQDWLLSTQTKRSTTGAWSAVNYAIPQVQEELLAFAEEAITQYDLDGISLDFFRHPVFFRRTFEGKKCGDAERAAMTSVVQRIHKMVAAESDRRGRELQLAIRVPDSVEYCHDIGLDLEEWLKNEWIDLLVVTGYFRLNEWKYSAMLGEKHNVTVLASLDESRVKDEQAQLARSSVESYLGRAAAVRSAGLSGVVTFNLFDPDSPVFQQLGDPILWPDSPKDFYASGRGVSRANGGNLPYAAYRKSETLNPADPISIKLGKTVSVDIALSPHSRLHRNLWLQFDRAVAADEIVVTVSGERIEMQSTEDKWFVSCDDLGHDNTTSLRVDVMLRTGNTPVRWLDAMIRDAMRF